MRFLLLQRTTISRTRRAMEKLSQRVATTKGHLSKNCPDKMNDKKSSNKNEKSSIGAVFSAVLLHIGSGASHHPNWLSDIKKSSIGEITAANKCGMKVSVFGNLMSSNLASNDLMTWHRHLGPINYADWKMVSSTASSLAKIEMARKTARFAWKLSQHHYRLNNTRKENILNLVHAHLCGPMENASIGVARYFLTFIFCNRRRSHQIDSRNSKNCSRIKQVVKLRCCDLITAQNSATRILTVSAKNRALNDN